MYRYTFYYIIDNVNYIFAVKHCKKPKQTKVYKQLKNLLNKRKVEAIGFTPNVLNY